MTSKTFLLIAITFSFWSCSQPKWIISDSSSVKIAMDSTKNATADTAYIAWLKPYKQKVDAQMNEVIGYSAVTMRAHKPESLLSNFSADVYLKAASDYIKTPVDIAIVNLGGLRTQVPEGDITVRKVFELMPFENELVVLWLRGDKLLDLLNGFAAVGGQGVAGLRMTIQAGKATDITIGGKALDPQKLYSIATNDYLAGGNDNMPQLAMHEKRQNTSLKVRNVLLDYIKGETAAGRKIESRLDGRIRQNP
ncbi:MAG: 5'-nucleotidase C-terminal domain-containing protein [Paludibacteraceae bacterium]|nr:5'-nucleotidase C-terminal domain-containing protein [Paludibacteraceae bacterium]